ncbi:MAG: DUF342 domain-containing protein [Thermoanaerobacteraceae bacterium]|nr:DUF342 domain-containing protein [Thermoanaerobacteraceae bacterium]
MDQNQEVLQVTISDNKLKAYLSAHEEVTVLDPESIHDALQAAGVIHGLKEEVVVSFAASPQVQPVLVAEGDPPQPGEDERVEVMFDNGQGRTEEVDEGKRIDFRETSSIVSVEKGTLLAVKHPPRPGLPGRTVTGEEIAPPAPRVYELRAGKGVELQENNTRVVSLVNGRPWYKRTGNTFVFHVDPLLVHHGDVCIKSGNIRFKGDVKIAGNVCEAMEVQATGSIEITGLVTRATVISGGRLQVHRGVIGSKLRAGTSFPGAKKLSFQLRDIQSNLELLKQALEQLKQYQGNNLSRVDFGRLLLTLMDTRFKNLRPLVKNTLRQIATARGEVPEEIARCGRSLNRLVGLNPLTVKSFGEVIRDVEAAAVLLQQNVDNPADVLIHSAMTSSIQSSGSVHVTRQGCVNTTINAGQDVIIKGSFKGGEIFCEGNAEIQELGSALGVPPVVRVGATGVIRVQRAFPGAVVQVGQRRQVLSQEMGSFRARLNKEGELDIIPGG